jgi:hypothetical protein
VRLAELAELHLSESHQGTLAEMNPFAVVGHYPDSPFPVPLLEEVRDDMDRVQEVFTCLNRLL